MTKQEKLTQVKDVIVKVISAISKQFSWLDYSELKIGRDSDLWNDNWTTVMLYYQRCTDKDGNYVDGSLLGFRNAEHYDDIYNHVGQVLEAQKLDTRIESITAGTYSRITDIPEVKYSEIEGQHYYGVRVDIAYNKK